MLRIDDLQVELDADAGIVRAIDGLELAINRGQTFALVGESGCGKSMTALALMRLLPDNCRVAAGHIELGHHQVVFVLGSERARMGDLRGHGAGSPHHAPGGTAIGGELEIELEVEGMGLRSA